MTLKMTCINIIERYTYLLGPSFSPQKAISFHICYICCYSKKRSKLLTEQRWRQFKETPIVPFGPRLSLSLVIRQERILFEKKKKVF